MAPSRPEATLDRVAGAIRVAGVPLRLQILRTVAANGPLSPSRFADGNDDVSLREAAYHFRYLRDGELLVLAELQTTGGTAQHFYKLTAIGRALVNALPAFEKAAGTR